MNSTQFQQENGDNSSLKKNDDIMFNIPMPGDDVEVNFEIPRVDDLISPNTMMSTFTNSPVRESPPPMSPIISPQQSRDVGNDNYILSGGENESNNFDAINNGYDQYNNGYQNNGYQNNNNGYQNNNNGYQDNNGYQSNNGYQNNNNYPLQSVGYSQQNPNGYQPQNPNSYPLQNSNGSNGYTTQSQNGCKPRNSIIISKQGSILQQNSNEYSPQSPNMFQQQNSNGYPPQSPQQNSNGYPPQSPQQNTNGYPPQSPQQNTNGYPPQSPNMCQQQNSNGYPPQSPNMCQQQSTIMITKQGSYLQQNINGYTPQNNINYSPSLVSNPPQQNASFVTSNTIVRDTSTLAAATATTVAEATASDVGFGICRSLCTNTRLLTEEEIKNACHEINTIINEYSNSNTGKLIEILSKYPPIQMDQIIIGFKNEYGKSMDSLVKSKVPSNNYGKLCIALSKTTLDYDVWCLYDAIKGLGTNNDCLIDILVGRTNKDIITLNKVYRSTYHKSLEDDIKGDTSGYFRQFLIALVQGNRDESNNERDVNLDVEALYKAGEGKIGTDERTFINIFINRSDKHLIKVFDKYQKNYKNSMVKAVKGEFSGEIKKSLIAHIKTIENRIEYIAEEFEKSMKGLGTRNEKLMRLVVRYRDPALMGPIKEVYMKKYGRTLKKRIEDDTSGNFRTLLINCVENCKPLQ